MFFWNDWLYIILPELPKQDGNRLAEQVWVFFVPPVSGNLLFFSFRPIVNAFRHTRGPLPVRMRYDQDLRGN